MNRIEALFRKKRKNVLSVYFTAGYPSLYSLEEIILNLEKFGADMIEIGIPYSDPLADGPVIQEAAKTAIMNGMSIQKLFSQLRGIRERSTVPLLLMGYVNPVMKFGIERFCSEASEAGIDGLIIPDLPAGEYAKDFRKHVEDAGLNFIFLITPDTSEERIIEIDELSSGFIYMVSSASTTGKTQVFGDIQMDYFRKIANTPLRNPVLAGFGIHNRETREQASKYVNGVIVGSAYIRALQNGESIGDATRSFLEKLM